MSPAPHIEVDGLLIRRTRVQAGLSQAELAYWLLTRHDVQGIESGRIRPPSSSLGHITGRLGFPLEALLREGGPSAEERVTELRRLCDAHCYREVAELADGLLRAPEPPTLLLAEVHYYARVANHQLGPPRKAIVHLRTARRHAAGLPESWTVAESLDWEAAARYALNDARALNMAREALSRCRRPHGQPDIEARMVEGVATMLTSAARTTKRTASTTRRCG